MLKLQVREYDAWYIEEEGSWWINESWIKGTIAVPDDKEETILRALIDGGFLLETCTMEDVDITWWEEDFCEVEQTEDGWPLYGLTVVKED